MALFTLQEMGHESDDKGFVNGIMRQPDMKKVK